VHGLMERKGDHEGSTHSVTLCFPVIGIHGHLRIACTGLRLGTNAHLLRLKLDSVVTVELMGSVFFITLDPVYVRSQILPLINCTNYRGFVSCLGLWIGFLIMVLIHKIYTPNFIATTTITFILCTI
jgi:hypothetical protein